MKFSGVQYWKSSIPDYQSTKKVPCRHKNVGLKTDPSPMKADTRNNSQNPRKINFGAVQAEPYADEG